MSNLAYLKYKVTRNSSWIRKFIEKLNNQIEQSKIFESEILTEISELTSIKKQVASDRSIAEVMLRNLKL